MALMIPTTRPAIQAFGGTGARGIEVAADQWLSWFVAAFLLGAAAGGLVFGWLGGEPAFGFPSFEHTDASVYSRALAMDFDTPYQVLAANSFDSQHFATVHNRILLEPPALSQVSPYHLGVEFRARVGGGQAHDRLLRRIKT